MKCRNITLALILLAVLTLTGCTYKHECTDLDCSNPQTDTKYEEPIEPALGHDWVDATCTTPATCTHCSAIHGEPLGHRYGDWAFEGELMRHSCSVCNYFEELPIDRALYLESLLDGFWDYWSIDHFGDSSHGGAGTNVNYLVFGENRSCQITITYDAGTYKGSGTWELQNYSKSEKEELYIIYIHTTAPRDEYLGIELHVSPDSINKISFTGPNYTRWFYQEQDKILEGLCTGWSIVNHYADQSYCFRFRPDHTVTCYVDGVFEGIWSLGAEPEDRSYVTFIIEYVRDGKPEEFKGYFYLPSQYYDVPTIELSSGNQMFHFHQVNDAELAIIQGATDLFAGTWASVGFGFSNPAFSKPATMDYTLTVEKDGSFALTLRSGKIYTGSWSAYAISAGSCQYHLYFNELKKSYNCTLHTINDAASLSLWDSKADAKTLFFTQVPEAYPVHTLPLGTWTSKDNSTFTFSENGSFTGLLGQEVRGTWTFNYYDESTTSGSNGHERVYDEWHYVLFFEGEAEPEYLHITKDKNAETFSLELTRTNPDGKRVRHVLTKD